MLSSWHSSHPRAVRHYAWCSGCFPMCVTAGFSGWLLQRGGRYRCHPVHGGQWCDADQCPWNHVPLLHGKQKDFAKACFVQNRDPAWTGIRLSEQHPHLCHGHSRHLTLVPHGAVRTIQATDAHQQCAHPGWDHNVDRNLHQPYRVRVGRERSNVGRQGRESAVIWDIWDHETGCHLLWDRRDLCGYLCSHRCDATGAPDV
mmetsp:Transcript_7462/g.45851  ORF Transcript_7462/g.45851 Transcript_7462/m.45851 type:complete len:201 (-) Transcript_7462:2014-2616(-)